MLTPFNENVQSWICLNEVSELSRNYLLRESLTYLYKNHLSLDCSNKDFQLHMGKCKSCLGTGILSQEKTLEEARRIDRIRPISNSDIDQCSLIDQDLARRVAHINHFFPSKNINLAFVGDDDLASILISKTRKLNKLLVLDIDVRILDTIKIQIEEKNCKHIELIKANLSKIHENYTLLKQNKHIESYDIAITDPPYANAGMLAFIYTACLLLKLGGTIHIAVPHLLCEEWSDDLMNLVQIELIHLGFVINSIIPGFYLYNSSDVISSLVVATKRRNTSLNELELRYKKINQHKFYTKRTNVENL